MGRLEKRNHPTGDFQNFLAAEPVSHFAAVFDCMGCDYPCGEPIILEAIIGLVTAFDIKADVLVSLALVASICIGEHFAAGEIAFIMQLGALLEDLTVAKARAGIEKGKCRNCYGWNRQ